MKEFEELSKILVDEEMAKENPNNEQYFHFGNVGSPEARGHIATTYPEEVASYGLDRIIDRAREQIFYLTGCHRAGLEEEGEDNV